MSDLVGFKLLAKCEAKRILDKVNYDPVTVFATSKIDPLPYQLEDYLKLVQWLELHDILERRYPGVRALLAYETGLGKTIVAGLFIKELLLRNERARILIVTPPPVIKQWIQEMGSKFELEFHEFQREEDLRKQLLIASVDTLKRKVKRIEERGSQWDLVVVDELHKATPGNRRYKLLEVLRDRTEHFLGLTATPHDGKEDHFLGRLKLINASVNQYNYQEFLKKWTFRRLKKNVVDTEGKLLFPYPVTVMTLPNNVTQEERDFYNAVEYYVREMYKMSKGPNTPVGLVATILGRIASSSVRAGIEAMRRRKERILTKEIRRDVNELIKRLKEAEEEEKELDEIYREILNLVFLENRDLVEMELHELDRIIELGEKVSKDSKLNNLKDVIDDHLKKGDKIIIFTSFVDTAEYLCHELKKILGDGVYIATGRIDEQTRNYNVRNFLERGKVLIGTEVIGESLNLQIANVVVNYEMPWSPITYIQRVGRVYRYPQKKPIFVYNFTSNLPVEQRVLEIIYQKVDNLVKDFDEGSVSVIGTEVSEEEVSKLVFEAYTKGVKEAEEKLRSEMGKVDEAIETVKKAIEVSEASAIHVDASILLKDPSELVTKDDLSRFLTLATELGVGTGDPSGNPASYYVGAIPVKNLSVNDKAIKKALEEASQAKAERSCFLWDGKTTEGVIYELEYQDGIGEPIYRELTIWTPDGFKPYKILDRAIPTECREDIVQGTISSPSLNDEYIEKRKASLYQSLSERVNYILAILNPELDSRSPLYKVDMTTVNNLKKKLLEKLKGVSVRIADEIGNITLIGYNTNVGYNLDLLRHKKEVERAAMEYVMNYEREKGCYPKDIHDENLGYDIESQCENQTKRIEVKGISKEDEDIILTSNEKKASEFFNDTFYLYVVVNPINNPRLIILKPPLELKEIQVIQYKLVQQY